MAPVLLGDDLAVVTEVADLPEAGVLLRLRRTAVVADRRVAVLVAGDQPRDEQHENGDGQADVDLPLLPLRHHRTTRRRRRAARAASAGTCRYTRTRCRRRLRA